MRSGSPELPPNNLLSDLGSKCVHPEGGIWVVQPSFHDRKRTVLLLMGRHEMGVEDRELRCHQVTNLLPLKPKKAA